MLRSSRQRAIKRSRSYLKTTDMSRSQLNAIPADTFHNRAGQTLKFCIGGDGFN